MNRLNKELLGYERHKYAPELNKFVFKSGNKLPAARCLNSVYWSYDGSNMPLMFKKWSSEVCRPKPHYRMLVIVYLEGYKDMGSEFVNSYKEAVEYANTLAHEQGLNIRTVKTVKKYFTY